MAQIGQVHTEVVQLLYRTFDSGFDSFSSQKELHKHCGDCTMVVFTNCVSTNNSSRNCVY